MSNKYILVTGAAGFIGSKVTQELLDLGRNVIAVDCFLPNLYSAESKRRRWESLKTHSSEIQLIKLEFDLRVDNFSRLSKFDIDSVINEAAMPGLSSDWSNFATYYECNLNALNRLLEFSKTKQLRSFIQASTSSVYGQSAVGDESQNLHPTSPYGISKLAAEKLLFAYAEWFSIPVKILRYFSVYGPHQRPDMAYAMLIEAINTNKPFTVFGNGEQKRSNTYIDDIVSATILAEENSMNNYVMNVCGDETVSLNEVIEILQEISGKKLILVGGANRTGDQKVTSGLNTKIKQTLGWESKTSIREGLLAQYEASLRTI